MQSLETRQKLSLSIPTLLPGKAAGLGRGTCSLQRAFAALSDIEFQLPGTKLITYYA